MNYTASLSQLWNKHKEWWSKADDTLAVAIVTQLPCSCFHVDDVAVFSSLLSSNQERSVWHCSIVARITNATEHSSVHWNETTWSTRIPWNPCVFKVISAWNSELLRQVAFNLSCPKQVVSNLWRAETSCNQVIVRFTNSTTFGAQTNRIQHFYDLNSHQWQVEPEIPRHRYQKTNYLLKPCQKACSRLFIEISDIRSAFLYAAEHDGSSNTEISAGASSCSYLWSFMR